MAHKKLNIFELDSDLSLDSINQRIFKRNWRFYGLPLFIFSLLFLDLCWEIVRTYNCTLIWPWKFTLLGITPAATLTAVFGSLIFAREQFAFTMKPNLSWSSHYAESNSIVGVAWVLYLMNAGPGMAIVENVRYSLKLVSNSDIIIKKNATAYEIAKVFSDLGFKEGEDFYFKLVTKGLPLPPVKLSTEGCIFFALKKEIIELIQILNCYVIILDPMGDRHIKPLPFMATLPHNYKEIKINNINNRLSTNNENL